MRYQVAGADGLVQQAGEKLRGVRRGGLAMELDGARELDGACARPGGRRDPARSVGLDAARDAPAVGVSRAMGEELPEVAVRHERIA